MCTCFKLLLLLWFLNVKSTWCFPANAPLFNIGRAETLEASKLNQILIFGCFLLFFSINGQILHISNIYIMCIYICIILLYNVSLLRIFYYVGFPKMAYAIYFWTYYFLKKKKLLKAKMFWGFLINFLGGWKRVWSHY